MFFKTRMYVLPSSKFRLVKAWWISRQLNKIIGFEKTWRILMWKKYPILHLAFPISFPVAEFDSFKLKFKLKCSIYMHFNFWRYLNFSETTSSEMPWKMAVLKYMENAEYYYARVYYVACHKLANWLRLRNESSAGAYAETCSFQWHLLQKVLPSFCGKKRMGHDRTYNDVLF